MKAEELIKQYQVEPYVHKPTQAAEIAVEDLTGKVDIDGVVRFDEDGVIILLDGILKKHADGQVTGVDIGKGLTADVKWADGVLSRAVIYASAPGEFTVLYDGKLARFKAEPQGKYGFDRELKDIWF